MQSYGRSAQDYSRAAPRQNYAYTRPALPSQQNYGYRPQTYPNRAQTYANRGYENRPQSYSYSYGYTGRSNYGYTGPQSYATRPSFAYSNPGGTYRAQQPDYSRGLSSRGYSNRSYENYGNTAARNERSGGFHLFGGGQSRSFSSQRAPSYSYKAPKSFGGGRQSFGGGHQSFGGGHMSAPKMSHSGGGGHRR